MTAHVARVLTPKPENGIVLPAAQKKGGLYANSAEYDLTELEHKQIMEMWRVTHEPYRKLLERYETHVKAVQKWNNNKRVRQKLRNIPLFRHWLPRDRENTDDERAMQRAYGKKAQVIY